MDTCASWSHDITLGDELVGASQARAFVRGRLAQHDLARLTDDVELVVTELATNATVHAHTVFTVSLHAFDGTLLLAVEDGSRDWPTRTFAAADLDTHGRGLAIVDLLSRDWGMDPLFAGKSVWAEFSLL